MEYRQLGRTDMKVSVISFGAWAIGGTWGPVKDEESITALHTAIDMGVNFIDTADVYGDGRSEKLIAQVLKERSETVYVATKAGRRLNPHVAEGYKDLEHFIDRSLKKLEVEALDLVQLHCPPNEVYYMPEVFDALDGLVKKGKLRYYGVSVEKVEEALKAVEFPNVQTVQIIFNMFRMRPTERFLPLAQEKQVGILARVPLASGLLTGKLTRASTFADDDHRKFNREGEAFDKGETFSGVDYETGLEAVEELKKLKPSGMTMAQFALRWITMFDAVTCAIPGAKRPDQARDNFGAADLPPLSDAVMAGVKAVYEKYIKDPVHYLW
ncbi:MAG: aldo/keto reductase [Anaerolineae bacterium]|nr:aldo/keto reductase [Anaerolineae bacterium]